MKKKALKTLLVSCCLLLVGYFLGGNKDSEIECNDLIFNNIDALATGEDGEDENIMCVGSDSVYCRGYWVEIKITGYSLLD